VAISNDSVQSHCEFGASLGGLDFPHVSDENLEVSRSYGVINDSGKGSRRSIFIIDRDGMLRHVNRAYQVGEESQYQEIFDTLAKI
jgi:peroxiredoxin (alkyl hydroperoxide reductase subunit C)